MSFRPRLLCTLCLTLTFAAHADKPRKVPPPLPAAQYPAHDTHELITIAADPGDTKETAPHTRLDYLGHGFMPIRIIVTNDSSQPLSLDDARILFISSNDVTENAATDEELDRGIFQLRNIKGKQIPLPAPLPPITRKPKSVDNQIQLDDRDFGFKSSTVAPHSTVAGWLYYDVRDLDQPVLKGAIIELRKVRWAATNKALDTFDIPLQPKNSDSQNP
ncbi:MAG TPA: hypothetical protein VMD97_06290 [Candidatus Aquilonibacter sp.]|nr:hypothetical protein [Candidatus Aquilonibacter sp.]